MISNRHVFDFGQLAYPSKDEVDEISSDFPSLRKFDFSYVDELKMLFEDNSLEMVQKRSALFWWDNHLTNKIGKLRISYIIAMANYRRGVLQSDGFSIRVEMTRIMYEYFSEIFYYHFFSVRDVILQIISLSFELPLTEEEVTMRCVLEKIENDAVKKALKNFKRKTNKAASIRNSFAHKFPLTKRDFRSTITGEGNEKVFSFGSGVTLEIVKVIENMKFSLDELQVLLDEIRPETISAGNLPNGLPR